MIRNDIEKLMGYLPSTLYSIKFFLFQQQLTAELSSELSNVKSIREMFSKSKFVELESKKVAILQYTDRQKLISELEILKAHDLYPAYILLVDEITQYLSENIKTTARIAIEDVPDEFVESLDDDGVRIFSEFFI